MLCGDDPQSGSLARLVASARSGWQDRMGLREVEMGTGARDVDFTVLGHKALKPLHSGRRLASGVRQQCTVFGVQVA